MADIKKPKLPTIVSPKGVAAYCHLREPDTKGKYADNKYKLTLKLPKAGAENQSEIDAFVKKLQAEHVKARGKKKTDSPVRDGDEKDFTGDGENPYAGRWLLTFKSKFPVQLMDSKKNELPKTVQPFGGDVVKVGFVALPYEEGKNAGISLQLRAVMLVEKNATGGQRDYSDAFGEEDGYESEGGGDDGDEKSNEDF
jgi:hypothetical protein